MAATTFGIIYGSVSNIIRRVVKPTTDDELLNEPLNPGESILITPDGPDDPDTLRQLVQTATGRPSPSSRMAVIDTAGNVIDIALIDPVLDGPTAYPGMSFVQSDVAIVGYTFSPTIGFTIPGYTIPAGIDKNGNPTPIIVVPPQIIPGTATAISAGI